MRLYVSGPMTGLPDLNYPAFNTVTAALREHGHTVYNPAEYDKDGRKFELRAGFREYAGWICDHAEGLYMLPGWEKSEGARAEHALAVALKLQIVYPAVAIA